jgi:hypothetical protein
MEIMKYKYSTGQMLGDVIWLFYLTLFFYMSINPNSDYKSWLIFGLVLLILLGRFIYLTVMYFIPCLKDKTALELDRDKLQLFITGKLLFQIPRDVAYWKDIKEIEYTSAFRGSPVISFKMNDGSVFGFRTAYIAGNNKDIYNTIMEYFKD